MFRSIKNRKKRGGGLVNSLIDKTPIELHIPFYQFCGIGTKLSERLDKGQLGINPLDAACREHDIAYFKNKELSIRHEADKVLQNKAWERVKARDSSLGEKIAALAVAGVMKGKRKLGMGIRRVGKRKKRVLKTPKKIGGFLPLLIPLLGGLAALIGGGAGVAKAVNDIKVSKEQLEELHRHNKTMEDLTRGKGLFIKPFKRLPSKGKGLYIKPYKGGSIKNKSLKKKLK